MENEKDTRLPLDEAWEAAMADYAERLVIVLSSDSMITGMIASFAIMDGMDTTASTANETQRLHLAVRKALTDPRVSKKMSGKDDCDCPACILRRQLEAAVAESKQTQEEK